MNVYPPEHLRYKAFELCPNPEVIIIGQDPYHTPGVADGLAFSTQCGKIPPSLRNILIELEASTGIGRTNPDLSDWARQGVLLMNTALSVEEGKPGSHAKLWRDFTKSKLEELSQKRNLVVMLWGNHAKKYRKIFTREDTLILEAAHPSPLSAHKGFFGCNHFELCNRYLVSKGRLPIDWW